MQEALDVLVRSGQAGILKRADRFAEMALNIASPSPELLEERVPRMQTVRHIWEAGNWLTAEELNSLKVAASKEEVASGE